LETEREFARRERRDGFQKFAAMADRSDTDLKIFSC